MFWDVQSTNFVFVFFVLGEFKIFAIEIRKCNERVSYLPIFMILTEKRNIYGC